MDDNRIRPGVWFAVVGGLALLALLVVLRPHKLDPDPDNGKAPAAAPTEAAVEAARASDREREGRGATRPAVPAEEPPLYIEGLVYGDIDLREAKALMPDNLYWTLGSPTKDPEVLAAREAERKKRNEEYGRVLSGDANEDEVKAYYDYRRQLSTDYLEFSEFMARRFREHGNDQFVGMLELATKLHAERLAALPAEMEEALARAAERAKVREDWQRQKEEFGEFPVERDPE